jgi:hypothetical protein
MAGGSPYFCHKSGAISRFLFWRTKNPAIPKSQIPFDFNFPYFALGIARQLHG